MPSSPTSVRSLQPSKLQAEKEKYKSRKPADAKKGKPPINYSAFFGQNKAALEEAVIRALEFGDVQEDEGRTGCFCFGRK